MPFYGLEFSVMRDAISAIRDIRFIPPAKVCPFKIPCTQTAQATGTGFVVTNSYLRRLSICRCNCLNLLPETHCSEVNTASKPASISIIDVARIIAMMVTMRGRKDISGFNVSVPRDNIVNVTDR
jgi:hypothetical protein